MYRLAWANGPIAPADKDIPNTVIHVADSLAGHCQHFHQRVSYPGMTDWDWYVRYRDAKAADPNRVHGIGVDELHPNQLNLGDLVGRMVNVDYWCASVGVPPPQWVLAINPGNTEAVDYTLTQIDSTFPGRVWWFVEGYIGLYKTEAEDYGLANARILLGRVIRAGLHDRAIYGINLSHKLVSGEPPGPYYYNVYGNDPALNQRNDDVYDRLATFVPEVVSVGQPFGFGVWTPSYSSPRTREDVDSLLTIVGA